MNVTKLNKLLDNAINNYIKESELRFSNFDSSCPATKEDLFELSKQTAYVLDEFRKSIFECYK